MSVVSRLKLIVPAVLMVAFAACSDAPTAAPESTTAATLPVPRAAIYVDYMDTVSAVK